VQTCIVFELLGFSMCTPSN